MFSRGLFVVRCLVNVKSMSSDNQIKVDAFSKDLYFSTGARASGLILSVESFFMLYCILM